MNNKHEHTDARPDASDVLARVDAFLGSPAGGAWLDSTLKAVTAIVLATQSGANLDQAQDSERLHPFWVARRGSDGHLIFASSPSVAMDEWDWSYLVDQEGVATTVDVFACEPQYPHISVEEVIDRFGEDNPEVSPLDETWGEYQGPSSVDALQSAVDKAVLEHFSPWYAVVDIHPVLTKEFGCDNHDP